MSLGNSPYCRCLCSDGSLKRDVDPISASRHPCDVVSRRGLKTQPKLRTSEFAVVITNDQLFIETKMLPSDSIVLSEVRCIIVATRKIAGHTDYAIRVQTNRCGGEDLVYRRFSAFLQLQQLARRHFQDSAACCGGTTSCLLTSCLERVFVDTEFPVMQGRLLGKNSKNVVSERVQFLNAFLLELEEAFCKCPPVVMACCEKKGCKIIKLLKSFYGCIGVSDM
ncbi:hypothetical protein PsorP6_001303 [Peronosclerospora sorghi]|uniref:Uncharacterized protein n=1 Tax=Peronosclerospora sorghi TaxID=230839 RepID=A0ACC0WSY1_9STRA|nr:hypothetical protein PsorP6_001303 [Peronosclerospora sorghi]